MPRSARHRHHRATLLLFALTFVLPRLLVPPGYMPGADHSGHWTLVFCDPALRAIFSGHVHSHHHSGHEGGDACPFAMSGGAALVSQVANASLRPVSHELRPITVTELATRIRSVAAHGARAPPVA